MRNYLYPTIRQIFTIQNYLYPASRQILLSLHPYFSIINDQNLCSVVFCLLFKMNVDVQSAKKETRKWILINFLDPRIIHNLDFWYRSQLVNEECVWLLERNKVTIGPGPCIFCLTCLSCQEYCGLLFSPVVVSGDNPVPGKIFAMCFITLTPTWQDWGRSNKRGPLARWWNVWKFAK